ADVLERLPPQLQRLPSLIYVTRDEALAVDGPTGSSGRQGNLLRRLSMAGARATQRAPGMKPGAPGEASLERREVRLFSNLFTGARVPFAHGVLEYTVLHEIAHELYFNDPSLAAQWFLFYGQTGRAEAPNAYAQQNADEGFAVAAGMYAVSPD